MTGCGCGCEMEANNEQERKTLRIVLFINVLMFFVEFIFGFIDCFVWWHTNITSGEMKSFNNDGGKRVKCDH